MRLSRRHIEVFTEVAKHLNVSKAAKVLGITQPAVSLQIAQLTRIMERPLIEIINHRVHLTEEGKKFLAKANSVRQQIEDLEGAFNTEEGKLFESLRISATGLNQYITFKLLGGFKAMHDEFNFDLSINPLTSMITRLERNTTDLVILHEPPRLTKLIRTELCDFNFHFVASSKHPLAGKSNLSIKDLKNQTFLLGEVGSHLRDDIENIIDRLNGDEKTITLEQSEALKTALLENIGISILPDYAIEHEVNAGLLKVLDIKDYARSGTLFLCHMKNKVLTGTAQQFIDYAKKSYKK